MNFTREEIQDLEDAIYFAAELIALKTGSFEHHSEKDMKRANKFVVRLLKLKARLGEPVEYKGRN